MTKPTERFTKAADDYVKYRPSYPKELIDVLEQECGLAKTSVVADIGSGTGILTSLLLEHGNTVYAVEPNKAMRQAAERELNHYPNFISVNATAEQTTLADRAVDLITVGTAFHWFEPKKTKQEFQRILKPKGWVLLIWNVRNIKESALLRDYESLMLKYSSDYKALRLGRLNVKNLTEFFSPNSMYKKSFPNIQQLDWQGLKGRLLSTSYSLRPGDENYQEMMQGLKAIFERHQVNNQVEFLYNTTICYGKLHPLPAEV